MPTLLFFPVNGSGMGHLTRCLAYARRLRERADCVFFSLSSAMEVVEEMGFAGDYFVSPLWSVNATYDWNCELAARFGMMLERTRPDVVVFDGTWPFQGFLAACRAYGHPLRLVWSNRGLLKKDAKTVPVDKSLFDLLIRPGELGGTPGEKRTPEGVRQLHVPPVLLLDNDDILPRTAAREQLGLRLEGRYALFSLGPGNLKDVSGPGLRLVREVQDAGFTVVWACAPISVRDVELPATVQPLAVCPLARYLRAFDIFVGAAGYNTCCEVAQAQIPSLIVPNTLLADDQTARARMLAAHAPVVVSPCETDADAQAAVRQLLARAEQRDKASCALALNGADLAAEAIWQLAQQ
ncbi:UDP-N-acetylglucosamine--N-acetylmuramyl-(pentapeptide) pyrophosphoryl-undecaprenol N-acetylglucosamine transferase [Desulfovibrio sp. ZJ369]|uniref:UDP-N-acetylglucosamine--N-acetylmuramyl- (pentapeptide) pyrophosphoryl-undecaprenol N-acetylglucosamine transferase n=1 Tax=Desulfovibrio sp. ZJ369 TaxID=2709793 RepID=UPI0013EC39BE|nr:UDP-N-acetylglucosamine--N-acetylmuramyl-(pentapeptide) pyrophosphoryl-undecaprenol N-acetylglucosamine transferase [Desulfovibrio sp. ZJ369]